MKSLVVVAMLSSGCMGTIGNLGGEGRSEPRRYPCKGVSLLTALTLIDLAIVAAATGSIIANDESLGYLAIPGVFLLSGGSGIVVLRRCRKPPEQKTPLESEDRRVLYRSGNKQSDTPVQSDDAPPPPALVKPFNPLRLPSDYEDSPESSIAPEPIPCGLDTLPACPSKQNCVIDEGGKGVCVLPEQERAPSVAPAR
tara:strand:- start:36663 stop:37253 length:591 start_codon:yes stop_codon:yes gene_type:complete